jgi:hypothetical protein
MQVSVSGVVMLRRLSSYPPATKCAHDFPDLGSCFAIGVPFGCFGGVTSPNSRDEGGSGCSGWVVASRILRGLEASCSVIGEEKARGELWEWKAHVGQRVEVSETSVC